MEIRKLVESDYDQVIELYTQLDEFHVQSRPDCFVHREKDKIYPKDAFVHNICIFRCNITQEQAVSFKKSHSLYLNNHGSTISSRQLRYNPTISEIG